MIANEIRPDAPNVSRKINKNRGERTELDHRDRRGRLLRISAVEVCPTARKHKMSGRAYRDELGQALHYTENDRL